MLLPILIAGDKAGSLVLITGDRDTTSLVGGHDMVQLSAVAKTVLSLQP